MLVLTVEQVKSFVTQAISLGQSVPFQLEVKDGGDVYRTVQIQHSSDSVRGLFQVIEEESQIIAVLASVEFTVYITVIAQLIQAQEKSLNIVNSISVNSQNYRITAYRKTSLDIAPVPEEVLLAPVREQLFSRLGGLFETDVLANKKVMIIGLGSGGSPIAIELVKSGVQCFVFMDHDRLEVGNVARHVCGLSDLGRYKTKAVKNLILDKNPYAQVETFELQLNWEYKDKFEQLVQDVDLVICATDNRESRMLINRVCVENNKVCLYGGAFRRAYGGQVLRVIPHVSMCYQCFLDYLPEIATDEEISNQDQVARVQYSPNDPTVPIEPGLSTDIAPISLLIAKLAILELLKGKTTSFDSLYDDFVAGWYIWYNRREGGGQSEKLPPLAYEVDNMHIMRWYGVEVGKNPYCSVCGDFLGSTEMKATQENINFFS
jgi:molybdopterin/thiamine biosynthesis adenylyltransferase